MRFSKYEFYNKLLGGDHGVTLLKVTLVGGLFCIVHWAGPPSAVMGPNILSKGVETSPVAAQLGLACVQTMPRLPGVCLWQTKLLQMSYGRQI